MITRTQIVFAVIVGGKLASSIPLENWVRNCKKEKKKRAWEGQKKLWGGGIGKITTEFTWEKGDEILPFMMFRAQSIFAAPPVWFHKIDLFFLLFLLHSCLIIIWWMAWHEKNITAVVMKDIVLALFFVLILSYINFSYVLSASSSTFFLGLPVNLKTWDTKPSWE